MSQRVAVALAHWRPDVGAWRLAADLEPLLRVGCQLDLCRFRTLGPGGPRTLLHFLGLGFDVFVLLDAVEDGEIVLHAGETTARFVGVVSHDDLMKTL